MSRQTRLKRTRFLAAKSGHNINNIINSEDHEFPFTQAGLEAAITDLPVYVYPHGGGKIWLPYGIMDVYTTIFVDRPVIFQGVGGGARTELRLVDGADCRLMELQAGAVNCHLRDIQFEGNKANQTAGDYLLYFVGGDYVKMRNCMVMRAYGVGIRLNMQDCLFTNVYVEFCDGIGWDIIPSQNISFFTCTSWANGGHGVVISGAGERTILVGCRICENVGGAGLLISEANSVQMYGGWVEENEQHGIYILDSDRITLRDVKVKDNSQAANNVNDGIYVGGDSSRVKIKGCNIFSVLANKQRYGIEEAGTADFNIFENNILYGNVTGQIFKIGTNTIMRGNQGNDDATAVVPTVPWTGMVYLDDGTNTGDAAPHYRYWDGLAWNDL